MSRIGQGSGLAAPTTFQSKIRRTAQPSTTTTAQDNQTLAQTSTQASKLGQSGRRATEVITKSGGTTTASNATSSMQQNSLASSTMIARQSSKGQAQLASTSRTTFLQRPTAEKQMMLNNVTSAITSSRTSTMNNNSSKASSNNTGTASNKNNATSSFTAAANQSQATTASNGANNSTTGGLQQRRSTLLQQASSALGAASSIGGGRTSQALTSSMTSSKLKENNSPAIGNQPKPLQSQTSFGFARQKTTIGGGPNKTSQPTAISKGTSNHASDKNQTSSMIGNPRYSMVLPATSGLVSSKGSQLAGPTSKLQSTTAATSSSTLAAKQQTGIQRAANRTSLLPSSSSAIASTQYQQQSTLANGQGKTSRIGKGGSGVIRHHQASSEAVAAPTAKKTGPRASANDKISVSPKLLKQQTTQRTTGSKIGGGTSVPAYNVALENKTTSQRKSTLQQQATKSSASNHNGHAVPLEKKLPSFDLKTPQRTHVRPPLPSESVTNPALLMNTTPEQQNLTRALIVGETSVEGNLGTANSIKYREPPSEEPPKPQRQSDMSKKQASPIQRPINSAQKSQNTMTPQQAQTVNLYQRQHSKLADLRQRKTLILQQNAPNNHQEDSKKQQRDQQLQQIQQLQTAFKQKQQQPPPVAVQGGEDEQLEGLLPPKSKSDVVINDFTAVDSQLATIKEQLEQSKQRNSLLSATYNQQSFYNNSVVPEEASAENLESFLVSNDDLVGDEHHQRPDQNQLTQPVVQVLGGTGGDSCPPQAKKPSYTRQASNSTPQQARTSVIPTMMEPDPCPFEQAKLSDECGKEQDIDLLADMMAVNDNKDSKHQQSGGDDESEEQVISARSRLSFLDSVKDSDRCPSKESIAQDMVEPMEAPSQQSLGSSDEAANVSADERENEHKINRIGVTKEYNLMLGFNHRQTDTKIPPPKQDDNVLIEVNKGELSKEVTLDLAKTEGVNAPQRSESTILPKPELSVTPRDWNQNRKVKEGSWTTKINKRPAVGNFVHSYIDDPDKQLQASTKIEHGAKSKSFVQLDVSHSQSLHTRRNMRQSTKISGGGQLTGGATQNSQSQSFTQQIQDLNLAAKLRNLQESISHLPNRVQRTRSNASNKGRNNNNNATMTSSSFHQHHHRAENSFGCGLNTLNSIDLTGGYQPLRSTPKQRDNQNSSNSGFLNVIAMRSSQRASMPPALDRNQKLQYAAAAAQVAADATPQYSAAADPFEQADELLLNDGGNGNMQMMHADMLMNDDDNLLLLDDEDDDHLDQSSFPPEFSQIEEKFQKSQLVMPSGPMIVEADREAEDEEDKKVGASTQRSNKNIKVPQKLHEFRKQAAAKEKQPHHQPNNKSGTNFSNMRTDFSMTSKQGTVSRTQSSIIKNATVKSKLSESLNQKKGNNLFGQRNTTKKADVLPIANPPQRSRLETLALPKSRRPAEQLEQILSPQNNTNDKDEKPKHMFRAQSNKSGSNFNSISNVTKETIVDQTQQSTTTQHQIISSTRASKSPLTNKVTSDAVNVSPRPQASSTAYSKQNTQRSKHNTSRLHTERQKRQTKSPQPFKREAATAAANNEKSALAQTTSFMSQTLGNRLTLLPMHTMVNSAAAKAMSARSGASKNVGGLAAVPQKKRVIKQIALYRDQQPIIGLRRRHFTQAIQQRHGEQPFFREGEYDVSEQPLEKIEMVQCPICKRSFEQGVFGEIHNQNDLCRRVFIQKRMPFDSQSQRVAWDEEMQQVLQQAKTSINFSQRNKLNPSWQHKRLMYKKYSAVHQARVKAHQKKIDNNGTLYCKLKVEWSLRDKIRLPVVYDPESPDEMVQGQDETADADHSLFMTDLSLIHDQTFDLKAGGFAAASKLRETSSLMEFELGHDTSLAVGDQAVADVRVPCDFCGRKFNPDVSLKHVPICMRNYEKKHGPISRRSTLNMQKKSSNAL